MDDDTDSADRPASKELEIEITPEMIEAGIDELAKFDVFPPIRSELRPAIRRVFLEMLKEYRRTDPRGASQGP